MTIRILIIKPGFGGGKNGTKYQMLRDDDNFIVSMPDIPEPTRGEKVDIKTGITILQHTIDSFRPDIIIAASRGNIYILELIKMDAITIGMPIFCISALKTRELCSANNGMQLLLLCHGTLDDRNSIDRVRVDCTTSKVAELVEFHNDIHSLPTLTTASSSSSSCGGGGQQQQQLLFLPLLHRLYHRSTNAEAYKQWVNEERPKWMTSQIEPKIREFEQKAKDAREGIHNHAGQSGKIMSGLLGAIRSKKREEE